jgi:tetratricopeptide (TPR) repeat protein
MHRDQVKIIPKRTEEFSVKVDIEGKTYLIESQDLGIQKHTVTTRVFCKGELLSSYEGDYKAIVDSPNFEITLINFMKTQQQKAIRNLRFDIIERRKPYKDYVKDAEVLIRINNEREALALLNRATEDHPNNPIIASYRGLLEAAVNKNYSEGIGLCKYAIRALKESTPLADSFFLPRLYLNLGKACLAANQKKQAYDSFIKGLRLDSKNPDFLAELEKLGRRKGPPVRFLKRSNPVNKYLGKLRSVITSK